MGDIIFEENQIENVTVNQNITRKEKNVALPSAKKVFIIYGCRNKNEILISEIKDFLNKKGIDGCILDDDLRIGTTVIDAFEKTATDCQAAIVLLTPSENRYPRPNVMFEWGYFLGKYSNCEKRNIILIKKANVEIPSDVNNMFFYSIKNSIEEIKNELSNALNKIFFQND